MEPVNSMMYQPLPSSYMGARMNTTVRNVMVRQLVDQNLSCLTQRGSSRPVKRSSSWHRATSAQTAMLNILDSSVYMVKTSSWP